MEKGLEHGTVKTIVVVGRDIPYAKHLANALRSFDYNIVEALDSSFTLDKLKLTKIDLFIIEANCGQVDTLALLDSILGSNLLIPIVCYADFAPQEYISSFQERGVAAFFLKPLCLDSLLEKMAPLMEKSREIPRGEPSLIASHPQSQAVLQAARRIASESAPLFITGETGVGKKTLALYSSILVSKPSPPKNHLLWHGC